MFITLTGGVGARQVFPLVDVFVDDLYFAGSEERPLYRVANCPDVEV